MEVRLTGRSQGEILHHNINNLYIDLSCSYIGIYIYIYGHIYVSKLIKFYIKIYMLYFSGKRK